MKLWQQVTLGLILGVVFGVLVKDKAILYYIKPIGDIFINMIKMIIVPLIFLSLVSGITSMSDPSSIGRIGFKAVVSYLLTTTFAIIIGLSTAILLKPGHGISLHFDNLSTNTAPIAQFDLTKFLVDIVPTNAVATLAGNNMLQVVFFAIFTGLTLNAMSSEGSKMINFFNLFAKLIFRMINIVMSFSPYGAFALTAWVVGTQGLEVLNSLFKLVMSVILGMSLQYLIFGLLILIFARISPIPFYKKSLEYQTIAFSTSSSKATLPTTMRVCTEQLGISKSNTSFVLPIGASMNMDGMAIYLGMCALFFAQATGTHLQPNDYMMIILTATLGSIGAAGIPGGSMVMLPMVLSSVHLPIEGVALIAGIDRILDMVRTTINLTGDATITLIIDKSEGTLDEKVYFSE
ncbi:MAG: dicarboxylate/amino acid:cation symporter [Rickettsiales endosymbiont of Dermacentor nuttalli]